MASIQCGFLLVACSPLNQQHVLVLVQHFASLLSKYAFNYKSGEYGGSEASS